MGKKQKKAKAEKAEAKRRRKARKKLPKALRKGLPTPVADVLAAGLGALDRAQKKGSEEFDALVARGRTVERKGHDAVRGASDRVGQVVDDTVGAAQARRAAAEIAVQSRIQAAVESAIGAVGVPTSGEVAALRAEIARLEARVAGAAAVGQMFRLAPHADGWALERDGADGAIETFATKKTGLVGARAHAKAHAPSTLVILRADGTEADRVGYDV